MSEQRDKRLRWIDASALAVCLLLSAAVYAAAIKPMLDEMAQRKQQQDELNQRETKAQGLTDSLAKMRETLAATDRTLSTQTFKLEPRNQLNHRLAKVTELADACNLEIDQIEPSAGMEGKHYVTVPILMAGRGDYLQATHFLQRLHQQWPDLAVASLELAGNPRNRGDQPRFTFELIWFASPAAGSNADTASDHLPDSLTDAQGQ